MLNYAIVGNCQGKCLNQFLQTNEEFNDKYKCISNIEVQKATAQEINTFHKLIIPQLDMLIIQPISDNYRNNIKYSTKYIINKIKPTCKVIMFPSIWFDDYYMHLNSSDSDANDEHDDIVRNNSINDLRTKENEAIRKYKPQNFIRISNFIKDNYKIYNLMYSLNHPSKYVYEFLTNRVLSICDVKHIEYPEELNPQKVDKNLILTTPKKKYTIVGNCQALALKKFLNANKHFTMRYEYIDIKPIHLISEEEINEFYENIMSSLDLVILQPISDDYKNNHKFSTRSVINNVNKTCKIILYPSIWFNGYYPQLIHNSIEKIGIIVHDKNIIHKAINNNKKVQFINKCKQMINSDNFYKPHYVNKIAQESINRLRKKEDIVISTYKNVSFIRISNFINSNYKKQILMHSLNHPSKYVYRFLANQILEIINIRRVVFPEELDPQKNLESCVIYKSVKNVINPKFNKQIFSQRGLINKKIGKYLDFHYDKYSSIRPYLTKTYKK
jgi:hypothetical protein